MNNLNVDKSQLIQAKILALQNGVPFKFDIANAENLANANIEVYGIEAFSATQAARGINGDTTVAAAGTPNILLTLVDKDNKEIFKDFPVYNLIRANTAGFITLLKNFKIDLTKCYVKLVNTTNLNANEVVLFNLYYRFI